MKSGPKDLKSWRFLSALGPLVDLGQCHIRLAIHIQIKTLRLFRSTLNLLYIECINATHTR